MSYKSILERRGAVEFPAFTAERVYMVPFLKAEGLPFDLSRWQPTVDAMLDGVETDQPVYLMIDQAEVKAGVPHRRPGLHVDGHWVPALRAHSGLGEGGGGSHRNPPGRHIVERNDWRNPARHTAPSYRPEAIILASDVSACRAFVGDYDTRLGAGGECPTLVTTRLREILLERHRVYAGNVAMLHESLPVAEDCLRTVVRLNVPGWSPEVTNA